MSKQNGGIIGPNNIPTGAFGSASGVWKLSDAINYKRQGTWPVVLNNFQVDNSARFNSGSSDYLSTTTGTATNTDKCTISFWVKRGFKASGDHKIIANYTDDSNRCFIFITGDNQFQIFQKLGGSTTISLKTNRLFKDFSAWYHFVIRVDTSQGTDTNRIKLYINGVQETSFATTTYPSQNENFRINESSVSLNIGRPGTDTEYFNGYLSEFVLLDGQTLDATSFGEFDSQTGIWVPKIVTGLTFGNNGFYLDFQNSGALGTDVSGNGNNFTVNNLTSIDQSIDTCTNNFATLNPIYKSSSQPTFSEGNLRQAPNAGTYQNAFSTIGVSSGKWYAEMKVNGSANSANYYGVVAETEYDYLQTNGNVVGTTDKAFAIAMASGDKRTNGSNSSYGSAIANTDIFMTALDIDNAKVWFGKNGTWFALGDPASGSNPAFSGINTDYPYFFGGTLYSGGYSSVDWNFSSPSYAISSGNVDSSGLGNFEYPVPEGFYSLCTKNLNLIG